MRRRAPSPNALREAALPDTPEPDLSKFRGMDDISVYLLIGKDPLAHLEAQRRLRFEIQWSGTWSSGPDNGWRSPR